MFLTILISLIPWLFFFFISLYLWVHDVRNNKQPNYKAATLWLAVIIVVIVALGILFFEWF